jgi:hypothetical protein
MQIFTTIATIAALTSYASAHINMQSPVPYNPAPDTSPLDASGSNYPCKAQGGFQVASQNTAAVGSTVKMSFMGSAVHNGGSCQVSLTKDGASSLSANSQFKVIYSILGGCPGTNGATVSYDVPIPSDVPAGDYTYSWTWFNNIGNREMYMNCAPMTITGGSGSDDTFNALPDMAVYNIASKNTCKTIETFDVDFPNPGKYVTKGANFKAQAPTCDGTDTGTGAGGAGSGSSGGSASTGNSNGGTPTSSANNGQYTGIGASGGGSQPQVQAPGAASSSVASSSVAVAAPSAISTPSAGGSNGTLTPAAPSTGTGSGTTSGAACSSEGTMVCSTDGSQFALCNHGSLIMMPVAAGTKCVNGAIQKKKRGVDVKLPFIFKG